MPIISIEKIKTKDKRKMQKMTKEKKKQSVSKTVKDVDNQHRDNEFKR